MYEKRRLSIDERTAEGFHLKSFVDESDNVELIVATDGDKTIVALPKAGIGLGRSMGDDELGCLKKCQAIGDLEKRLNCILKCPVTKAFDVFVKAE